MILALILIGFVLVTGIVQFFLYKNHKRAMRNLDQIRGPPMGIWERWNRIKKLGRMGKDPAAGEH